MVDRSALAANVGGMGRYSDRDVVITSTAGGTTKYGTLFDHDDASSTTW